MKLNAKTRKILMIVLPATLAVAVGIMALAGVFAGPDGPIIAFERPFIKTSLVEADPQTVSELLNHESPDLEILLGKKVLQDELLASDKLTDVVNSRLSLNGLRTLRSAAEALISERDEESALLAPEDGSPTEYVRLAAASADHLLAVKGKMDVLLAPMPVSAGLLLPQIDLRGVWTDDEIVLLRWMPHDTWIPDQGYRLMRTIDGQTTEIASRLGSADFRLANLDKHAEYSDMFVEMFGLAELTSDKLADIGIQTSDDFAGLAYAGGTPNASRERVDGAFDFGWLGLRLLTVPGTLAEKLPVNDAIQMTTIQAGRSINPATTAFSTDKLFNLSAMAVIAPVIRQPFEDLAENRARLVGEILESRQGILSKAFTDLNFAEDAGLGFQDNLKDLDLADGTVVSYRLEASDGLSAALDITTGEEIPIRQPQGLDGFGVDNRVALRWQATLDESDRRLIAGYWIERKKENENSFKRINGVPVAISYSLDETGVFFETPSFYEDLSLLNGQTATYRIQALDIFGRTSIYSEERSMSVYKVTPPSIPAVEQPLLSSDATARKDAFYREIADLNQGEDGVILPVSKTSDDTVTFVIYRARAEGAGPFSEPDEVGRVTLDTTIQKTIRQGKTQLIINPKTTTSADLAWFDSDIAPGWSYKYWAASVDTWGNESAWSNARVIGLDAASPPAAPTGLTAELLRNALPDLSLKAPGFGVNMIDSRVLSELAADEEPIIVRPGTSDIVKQAQVGQIKIGVSISDLKLADSQGAPSDLSDAYGNLPDITDVHTIIAISYDELRPDQSALVKWLAYSGSGLGGYHVYRTAVDGTTLETLQQMSRAEVLAAYPWHLVKAGVTTNQFVDITLEPQAGRLHLYLVILAPEAPFGSNFNLADFNLPDGLTSYEPGGWVQLNWQQPDDPQVGSFRIYRAEVEAFSDGQNPDELDWNLVGSSAGYTSYTEKVDQTYAHYYYYRVKSVDVWGLESDGNVTIPFRVPATSPPQTPSMLLPLAQKGQIQVNWAGVAHADHYIVYRSTLPKIAEEDLLGIKTQLPEVYDRIFNEPLAGDNFVIKRFSISGSRPVKPAADTPVLSIDKFNTLQQVDPAELQISVGKIDNIDKLELFQKVADKYGPLALRNYSQLTEAAAMMVLWDKVAQIPADSVADPLGAYSYIDQDVVFGDSYYYTVQAVNDDELASARPMPVLSSPRKNGPFDPVTGLNGQVREARPELAWSQAKDANLTWEQSREFVAGYIVYRSTAENGPYYQASPLLPDMKWRDESADPAAFNWYKVKVVDTAGYLSEASTAVLVRETPSFEIIDRLRPITGIFKPINPGGQTTVTYEKLTIGDFTINNAELVMTSAGLTSAYRIGNGTGSMSFGLDESFEVKLTNVSLGTVPGVEPTVESRILRGTISISKAVYLPKAGVTFTQLLLDAETAVCRVDGYLQSPAGADGKVTRNLMGDLYALPFTSSQITADGRLSVAEVPSFRYGQLIIDATANAVAALDPVAGKMPRIRLLAGSATYHIDLETLDNAGLRYNYRTLSFDINGALTGALTLDGPQTLRLVIPAGMGLKAEKSVLEYANGEIKASGSLLTGKIILPFKTFDDTYVPPPEITLPDFADSKVLQGFDRFLPAGVGDQAETPAQIAGSLTVDEIADLDHSVIYLANRIQSTSLLVLPATEERRSRLSAAILNIPQWDGHGISMTETTMTPANVGNSGADTSEAIGVTPGRVALDLDRGTAVAVSGAPAETGENFWLGIIVKEGRLALPSAYVKQDDGSRISFNLTAGELLYDLNGVAYQNLIYNPEGTPVDLGEKLGNFRDVKIFDCMLDLYGNRVNIEMNGEMGIPLFNYEKGKIKLYTNKDGDLVCTMAETPVIDAARTGEVMVTILGGSLMEDGLHVNGILDLNFPDKLVMNGMSFSELIIPADMAMLTEEQNEDRHYGTAIFDQPHKVDFHDFPIELRALNFTSSKSSFALAMMPATLSGGLNREYKLKGLLMPSVAVDFYQSSLTLWGGLQVSDNIAMNVKENFDRIVIANAMSKPELRYEESVSRLDFEFEEFVKVNGVLKPVPAAEDAGYVEFTTVGDTLDMAFNTVSDLAGFSVEINTRFGYDLEYDRYFFVLGSYYGDPQGISFYYGKIKDINGVIGYNVSLPKEADGRFAIPKGKSALFDSVDDLAVDRTPGGNYFFATTAKLEFGISVQGATLKIVEIRNVYLVVDKGPNLEAGGDLYTPHDIDALTTGNGFGYSGYTRIGYYHPQRLFQFDAVIEDLSFYSLKVSGSMGCQVNPVFWEVRVGYPDAMMAKVAGIADVGFGIMFRSSDIPDDSYIKARIFFNFDSEASISIVYVRAWLNAGAEGYYEFDSKRLMLEVWLNGGVEGGIKVAGKRYNIISLMLNAKGELVGQVGQKWKLGAEVRIYYSLDLWLDEIEGSVKWRISTSF